MTESHNPTKGAKVSLEVDEDSTLNQFNVETGGEAVQILVKQPNVVVNIRKPPVELISYEAVTSKMKFKR